MAEFSSWGVFENGMPTGLGKPFFSLSWFTFILTFLNFLGCVKVKALTPEHPS